MNGAWASLLIAGFVLSCSEVAEVLRGDVAVGGSAAGGSGGAANGAAAGLAGGARSGAGGDGGEPPLDDVSPPDPNLGTFLDAGDAHACAARHGVLYCWGAGGDGRLGNGSVEDRVAPVRVGSSADWIVVATGVAHTCALKRDGSVWCFGANNVGQLGQGSVAPSSVPVQVPLPGKAIQLSSEANTACSVLESGELWCWGRNWEGNIGLGDQHPGVDQLSPVRSGMDADWRLSATGDGHTCGVRGAGLLFGWGRNTAGNLGLGQTTDQQRRSATQIGVDSDWLSVVSGQDSSCGLRAGGRLFCWGGNAFGNLGLGDSVQRLVPTEVVPGRAWSQIAIDTFHGCGIDAEQNLHCWGRAIEGQLGTGDLTERYEPTLIGGGFAQVVVGRMSTCALEGAASGPNARAAVLCTGENAAGQLGVGDTARRSTLAEVTFPD
jgi:alpha-tubulin suppressor-like RCC1 family protein